ncbi:MAG: hypothetical protein ABIQ95_11140 [Bdellovibrionia bacterium]
MPSRSVIWNVRVLVILAAFQINNAVAGSDDYYKSELTGGVDATTGFVRINTITANFVQYYFTGSYSYSLDRQFQVGLQGTISDSSAQIDGFRYSIYIPFTVNWGGVDLRDDYFFRVSPGISYYNALDTALLVQFGKRFKVFDNFSWRPTVGLNGNFGNGAARLAIDIIPVAFSLIF